MKLGSRDRVVLQRKRPDPPEFIDDDERQARHELACKAIAVMGDRALAEYLHLERVQVRQWQRDDRPVPRRHLETLEAIIAQAANDEA